MAPNYPHPPSASIIKPPPPSRTNSTYEVSRSHADQPAVGRTRAEPHGVVPSTESHVVGREAGQVTTVPLSRTPSHQARVRPETENTNSAPSHPSRPPSHRVPSSNAIPTVSGPRPHRTSQALQPSDPPTRPPTTAPYAPAVTLSQSHQSVPPSPANSSNSSSANARHVRGPSSAHTSPKDVQPAVSSPYHDTHNRPAHIQRAPSGAPLPILLHFSLLRSLALLLSTLIILGIHLLATTNNIHHRPTGLMSSSHQYNTATKPGYGVPWPHKVRQRPQRTFQ